MSKHPNPMVSQRVASMLWRLVEAERRRASDEANFPLKRDLVLATAAELERVHNAYCAGIVAEVQPPFTRGEAT